MRSLVLIPLAAAAIAGCSSGDEGRQPTETTTTTATASAQTHTPAPGAVEIAPGGATTAIGADAESTEEEYSKACQAAKAWIDQQGGDDRQAHLEPYLRMLQDPATPPGAGTYGTPWAQLSPARQSAALVAAQAGADSLC